MERTLTREFPVPVSQCAADGRLSLPGVFNMFMDMATLHAKVLGIGLEELSPRGLFWLTVRTKIRVYRRPGLTEEISVTTWPEKPGKLRSYRDYVLRDTQGVAAEGKTEWAVINTGTGRLTPVEEVFPPELREALTDETVLPEPFSRIREQFAPEDAWASYTVRSTDIDLGGHMNNAAYPRMVLGAFSNRELEELKIREMELYFRAPCYEGDTLTLCRRPTDTGWELGAFLPDGKTVLLGKISG